MSATLGALAGNQTVRASGTGCTASACEIAFEAAVPVNVRSITEGASTTARFSEASPDRIARAIDQSLTDELLLAVGTKTSPGTPAQASAAAAAAGGVITAGYPDTGLYEVRWAADQNIAARIAELKAQPGVLEASTSDVGTIETLSLVPTGPGLDGERWTWPYTQIRAPEAWALAGTKGVTVGIIDEGFVHRNHQDVEVAEIRGRYGFGSDHPTHVAGLACALPNSFGMVGAGAGCPVITASGLDDSKETNNKAVYDAMHDMATKTAAKVVNVSLGEGRLEKRETPGDTNYCYTQSESNKASERGAAAQLTFRSLFTQVGRDIVWTFAAGNRCIDGPASAWAMNSYLPNVLTVGATNSTGNLASFSGFGPEVEIAAPGGIHVPTGSSGLLSSSTDNGSTNNGVSQFCLPEDGLPDDAFCNLYETQAGTSMASPIVAGVASLAWAAAPSLKANDIGRCLISTAATGATRTVDRQDPEPRTVNGATISPRVPFNRPKIPTVNAEAAVRCAKDLLASGSNPYTKLTDPNWGDNNTPGAVWLDRTYSVNYGGGAFRLAGSEDGVASVLVDDIARVDVIGPDGETRTWEHDFFPGCVYHEDLEGPFDLQSLLRLGLNEVRIQLRDNCGDKQGAKTPLWWTFDSSSVD